MGGTGPILIHQCKRGLSLGASGCPSHLLGLLADGDDFQFGEGGERFGGVEGGQGDETDELGGDRFLQPDGFRGGVCGKAAGGDRLSPGFAVEAGIKAEFFDPAVVVVVVSWRENDALDVDRLIEAEDDVVGKGRCAVAPDGVPHGGRIAVDDVGAFVARLLAGAMDDLCTEALEEAEVAEQAAQIGRLEAHRGLKVIACGVLQQAGAQLCGGGACAKVGIEVCRAEQEAALCDLCLDNDAQFAAGIPIIDHLDHRLEAVGECVEDHRFGVVLNILPLPIGVECGGELSERGVLGVKEEPEGVLGLAGEPHFVPEDGVKSADGIAGDGAWVCEEHDSAAGLQCIDGGLVELVCDGDLVGFFGLRGL